MDKPIFHQSAIKLYSICPKQYWFLKVAGVKRETISSKMLFGSVYHEAVDQLHQGVVVDEACLREIIDTIEKAEETPTWWDDRQAEIDEWLLDAVPTLNNYWSKPFNREAKILLSEKEFTVKIGSFDFAGRIDQVRQTPEGELVLIDYKSGLMPNGEAEFELDYQLSIYAYALKHDTTLGIERFPDKVGRYLLHDHLPYKRNGKKGDGTPYFKGNERGNGLYTTTRTEADYDAMIQDLSIICRQIVGPHFNAKTNRLESGGAFPRTPNFLNCGMCPVRQECIDDRRANIIQQPINVELTEEDFVV